MSSNLASAEATVWTSLEVTKLVVQASLPLVVLLLGVLIARRTRALEQAIWQRQKAIEWKQTLFNSTIGNLNKLFCAFNYVGIWERLTPEDVIATKRELDTAIYGYKLLLNAKTLEAYEELMRAAFDTSRGRGKHIRIKANIEMYKEVAQECEDRYEEMFVPKEVRTRREEFNLRYDKFLALYFNDVGIGT